MHTQEPRNLPSETQKFASFLLSFLESYPQDGRNVPKDQMDDDSNWFYFERETNDLKDALTGFLTFYIHHPDGSSLLPGMKWLPDAIEPRPSESRLSNAKTNANPESQPSNESSVYSGTEVARSTVSNGRTPVITKDAAENISIYPTRNASNLDVNMPVARVTKPQSERQHITKGEVIGRATPMKRTSEHIHNGNGFERVAKRKPVVLPSLFRLPMSDVSTNPAQLQRLGQTTVGKQSSQKPLPTKHVKTSRATAPRKPPFILPKPIHYPTPWDNTYGEILRRMGY